MEYTVLIVDDVAKNLQILGNILRDDGIHSYAALSGNQALAVLKHTAIDLVLLDISMPNMDGYEICRRVKQDPELNNIPIIFLTARSQTEDIVKAFECGGVDFVTKPFNSAELLQRIKTHLKLKRYEDTLARQNRELQQLNATKDRFFSIIAHDLRNPFNSLLNVAEILLRDSHVLETSKQQELMQIMYNSAKSTYLLIENLLLWSRSQRNKITYNPQLMQVAPLLYEVRMLMEHTQARSKNIELILDDLEPELQVIADQSMFNTIIRNLLSNAIKFSPANSKINFGAKTIDDNKILFYVQDYGIGMDENKLAQLFKIEYAYSEPGTAEEQGTGLGLILCKEFIEKHKGEIWAESTAQQGSIFYVTLSADKYTS